MNENPSLWKFAIIDIATSVELFLKERLRREHPVLIYTKIDDGSGHTVSLEVALKRLRVCHVTVEPEDVVRLNRARDIRNSIIHFNTEATGEQLEAAYIDLLEFAHSFHARELGGEIHDGIKEGWWESLALFMEQFRNEFVSYHGETVHRAWPAALVGAQYNRNWIIDGVPYRRIRYGGEGEHRDSVPTKPCHDCAALPGQLHGPDCDQERCPKCGGQTLIGCCGEDMVWSS